MNTLFRVLGELLEALVVVPGVAARKLVGILVYTFVGSTEVLRTFVDDFSKALESLPKLVALRLGQLVGLSISRLSGNQERHRDPPKTHFGPPKFGEYLILMVLSKQDRINLIGDLKEEYKQIEESFGRRSAVHWYYKQVLTSIGPLVWKQLVKWGVLAWIGEWLRRHI